MSMEEKKIDKNLLQAINLLEKSVHGESVSESEIEQLKKDSGVILEAEIFSLGAVQGGFYGFKMQTPGRPDKYFYCDPDDVEFYDYCIPVAIKMDKDFVSRKKRIGLREVSLKENNGKIVDIQDAVKSLSKSQALKKINNLANSLQNNNA